MTLIAQRYRLREARGPYGLIAEVFARGRQLHVGSSSGQRHLLWAEGRVISDGNGTCQSADRRGLKRDRESTTCSWIQCGRTGVRLAEWRSHPDVGDIQDSEPCVGEGGSFGFAGREHDLSREDEVCRRELYGRFDAIACQRNCLSDLGSIVGDRNRTAACASCDRVEDNTDRATRCWGYRSAARVGLGEIRDVCSRDRNGRDAQCNVPFVRECDVCRTSGHSQGLVPKANLDP